jgi:sporulation protein YlmC with PRC-barrel domain
MLRSLHDLKGFTIGATDGDIGTIEDVYFDDVSFTVRHLVVDTSGWLQRRKGLVSPLALRGIDWEGKRVRAALTTAQVEQSPDIESHLPVSRQREMDYYRYYDYPVYWEGAYLWGTVAEPGALVSPRPEVVPERERRWSWAEHGDRHLRSAGEVAGYYIHATDGDIGHVDDFLIDDVSWTIRYLVVDTRNWWPGKKVLISPEWIQRIEWEDSKVYVDLGRDLIRNGPEYSFTAPVDRDYERRLHEHYGRRRYWDDWRDVA